jgi:hypothetical protein
MKTEPEIMMCFFSGSCPFMVNFDVWEVANDVRLEPGEKC